MPFFLPLGSAWLIWSLSCRRSICNRKRWPHFCWKPIPVGYQTLQHHCSSRRTMCRCCSPLPIYTRRKSVASVASALDDRWRSVGAAAWAAKRGEEETRKQEQQQDQSSLPIIKGGKTVGSSIIIISRIIPKQSETSKYSSEFSFHWFCDIPYNESSV